MITVTVRSATFDGGRWVVYCDVQDATGTRSGPHWVDLPETATHADLSEAIAALYT